MRIVAGRLRGRPIMSPAGTQTRPTSDRARESLFNILAHGRFRPPGTAPLPRDARVLDLFAGSGALGLEAVSRGASRAVFVETDADARAALRRNVEALELGGVAQILRRDATGLGPLPAGAAGPFDLVFLDPPYGRGLVAPAIASVQAGGWIGPAAVIVAELGPEDAPPEPAGFELLDSRRSGKAHFVFYGRKGQPG